MEEFEIEDENAQGAEVHVAEETNDAPAENAIEVGDKSTTDIAKLEDKVVIPVIPETLNINGVELNIANLTKKMHKVKLMKIDGLTDEKGYDEAVAELKSISKLRTGSEKWRQDTMKPVLKFQKDLKKVIDDAGVLCSEGEKHLKAIIEPIDNFKEEARLKAEKDKDELQIKRAELLIASGVPYDGRGTYNSTLDAETFVLHDDLRVLTEEEWDALYNPIKSAWDADVLAKQQAEVQKANHTNQLTQQVEDLNAERTEMRKEILEARGFEFEPVLEVYIKGDISITAQQVINTATKAEWDALFVIASSVEAPKPIVTSTGGSFTIPEEKASTLQPSTSFDIASDFEVEETPIAETETQTSKDNGGVQPEKTDNNENPSYGINLDFSKGKPFIEFAISGNFKIRLYNKHLEELALADIPKDKLVNTHEINDSLWHALISIAK